MGTISPLHNIFLCDNGYDPPYKYTLFKEKFKLHLGYLSKPITNMWEISMDKKQKMAKDEFLGKSYETKALALRNTEIFNKDLEKDENNNTIFSKET